MCENYRYVDKLMPSATTVEIRLDPNHPASSSISLIEGYLYALYVDRIIEADVPHDPDAEWVEPKADSDLMILVEPTTPRSARANPV